MGVEITAALRSVAASPTSYRKESICLPTLIHSI